MFLILFRRLIFLLLGIGILILGAVLKNFIIILAGVCLLILFLLKKKWKRRKKKNKKRK